MHEFWSRRKHRAELIRESWRHTSAPLLLHRITFTLGAVHADPPLTPGLCARLLGPVS